MESPPDAGVGLDMNSGTALEDSVSDRVVLRGFNSTFLGAPLDQFGLSEIELKRPLGALDSEAPIEFGVVPIAASVVTHGYTTKRESGETCVSMYRVECAHVSGR